MVLDLSACSAPNVEHRISVNSAANAFAVKFIDYNPFYVQTELRGWRVIVNRQVLATQSVITYDALSLLDRQLREIERRVDGRPVRQLKLVPIWMEFEVCNAVPGSAYHWEAEWLRGQKNCTVDKAGAVEIGMRDFLAWDPIQPWAAMHELAHAYHHRVLEEANSDVAAAFSSAEQTGLYKNVLRWDGKRDVAYALNNEKEYFAELTEAYFGRNDFYPFNRRDLRRHDPHGFALMQKAWCAKTKFSGRRQPCPGEPLATMHGSPHQEGQR